MKKRMLASLLTLAVLLGLMPPARAYAADEAQKTTAEHWFYDQLSDGAQGIYDALEKAYKAGTLSDGTASIVLDVDGKDVESYIKGNRALFLDFAAAKDAFDLEHPEAWYVDSSKLALTAEGTTASVGTGYTDTYYVDGVEDASDVESRTEALDAAVDAIVSGARGYSTAEEKVRYVHDRIINSISYRFEYQCSEGNAGYIRTAYALVTHEGVCEGYARSFQYALNKLNIPCVLIHGIQNSDNDPQEHMWCAVCLDGVWYAVDPTWDDPVVLPEAKSVSDGKGVDGGERDTYCLVGQDKIGSYWHPLGVVSTGGMEFEYPDIAARSRGSGVLESNGLKVVYDDGRMEASKSTVYQISYNGGGLAAAAREGCYLLTRMYDLNADGSTDAIDEWYYAAHGLAALGPDDETYDFVNFVGHGNDYYHDEAACLVQAVSNCEYVEYAVTDIAPPKWETPEDLYYVSSDGTLEANGGYYDYERYGEDHILAQTGLIYNPNGSYEQPPYVKNLSPAITESVYVGRTYTVHAEFTEPLFHPDDASIQVSASLGKVNDASKAQGERVALDYTGTTYAWGVNAKMPHVFADKPEPQNVRWACETHGTHTSMEEIERYGSKCRLTALEFDFTPSRMWADDSVTYDFQLTGLVGVKSNKRLRQGAISFVFENMSAFCAYRCPLKGGIDWNLWGQPQLLDNPDHLDFSQIIIEGIDGAEDTRQSVEELYASTNQDPNDMNGRLLLVVENVNSTRERGQELAGALDQEAGVDLYDSESVLSSMLYEIDFARICGKTVVKTGDSLRMQVGFPEGFDASKLAGTVFKIYHFIKGDPKNPDKITGVEEIPVTVTPYGLVFVVNSFSPFAVVAEKADGAADTARYVVMAGEGHGTLSSDYTAPEGGDEVDGAVKFTGTGDAHTFTITPDEGYEVEEITSTGITKTISCEDGRTFRLTYEDISQANAIISVSFRAKFGGDVERTAPAAVKTVSLCSHLSTREETEYKAATCLAEGHTAKVVCEDCGQVVSDSQVIPVADHVYETDSEYEEPTCEAPGSTLTCKVCGVTSQALASGHDYVKGVCTVCKEPEPCTIMFYANGGAFGGGEELHTEQVSAGAELEQWPAPEREGYTLKGWYTVAELPGLKDEVKRDNAFTKSMAVYAAWTKPSSGSGGTGGGSSGNSGSGGGTGGGSGSGSSGGSSSSGGSGGSGSSGSGGSGSSGGTGGSPASGTAVTRNPDGSVTTTVTDQAAGTVTETTEYADGSVKAVETASDGTVTTRETRADGVEITTVKAPGIAVTGSVTLPAGMTGAVVLIEAAVTPGTVAVDAATGEVIMSSVPVDGGIRMTLDESVSFRLEDRGMVFPDTSNHWASDSVAFVTAHGLFNGTGDGLFSPNQHMTRAMLMTVLARLNGIDTDGGGIWYEKGMQWAVSAGISDGSNPSGDITREQLATMLWRYAGTPAASRDLFGYPDSGEIHDWSEEAMKWAVQNGIIQGSGGRLNPGGPALRSEVAAMIERFCKNVGV